MTILDKSHEIVTVDRPVHLPIGERIMREVAAKYGLTTTHLRLRWHRWAIVPARIEAAYRLTYEAGYNRPIVARIMHRDPSTISFYLGRVTRRKPMHIPVNMGVST